MVKVTMYDCTLDLIALNVARKFTADDEPQRRALLQRAVLDAMKNAHAPVLQISKEMRDAAGDFEKWGRDVIEGFADRLDAIAAAPKLAGD